MSDCSAKAGEPQKTCGNCHMYDEDNAQCDYFVMERGKEVHEQHSPEDSACEDWEKTELFTEQRCQKLEQVARDMHNALNYCSSGCSAGCPMLDDGCTVSSGELRSRLETLGVSLDG